MGDYEETGAGHCNEGLHFSSPFMQGNVVDV